MNKEFVSFDLAKKLKEKGFRWDCFAYYMPHSDELIYNVKPYKGITLYSFNSLRKELISSDFIDAPTISQVLKWLREEKKLHIMMATYSHYPNNTHDWGYEILNLQTYTCELYRCRFNSYEQAAIAGIECVIDNLI